MLFILYMLLPFWFLESIAPTPSPENFLFSKHFERKKMNSLNMVKLALTLLCYFSQKSKRIFAIKSLNVL